MFVRKARAGADSYGNHWPGDGDVLDLPAAQATDLVSIPDGGFTIVDTSPAPVLPPAGDGEPDPEDEAVEVTEPAPAPAAAVTEPAPKRTGTRRPTRKA